MSMRLSFKTISPHIDLADSRSIKKWCDRHGISYFRDGRDLYVWEEEYEMRRPKFEFVEKSTNIAAPVILDSYIPKSRMAREFLRKYR